MYRTKDKVWLNLRNIRSDRPSKKLDWLHARYTVLETPSPHTVRLDVPNGVHPVFHVELVRPAASDPLPSQIVDDSQLPPVIIDDEPEWEIEEILAARTKRIGRGSRRQVLVKWLGYAERTWENLDAVRDCAALDRFEDRYGDVLTNNGPLHLYQLAERLKTGSARLRMGGGGYCNGPGPDAHHVPARELSSYLHRSTQSCLCFLQAFGKQFEA
jgi:hypothetical protein